MTAMATEAPAKAQGKGGKQQQVVAARPFVTGTRTLESETYSASVTLSSSTQPYSSASTMLRKTGPRWKENSPWAWS